MARSEARQWRVYGWSVWLQEGPKSCREDGKVDNPMPGHMDFFSCSSNKVVEAAPCYRGSIQGHHGLLDDIKVSSSVPLCAAGTLSKFVLQIR